MEQQIVSNWWYRTELAALQLLVLLSRLIRRNLFLATFSVYFHCFLWQIYTMQSIKCNNMYMKQRRDKNVLLMNHKKIFCKCWDSLWSTIIPILNLYCNLFFSSCTSSIMMFFPKWYNYVLETCIGSFHIKKYIDIPMHTLGNL